jgi:3-deoxy-D-manno-octulosonic-acid transferase
MEVEIWPNLLYAAREQGLPLFLANARLSERSRIRYQRLGRLVRDSLDAFTAVAAQTEADAERFRALSPGSAVLTVGNVKFDIPAADNLEPLRQQFTALVDGGQRAVWVAGSTREGEEALLLDVHERLLEMLPSAVLILVPRHPERFDAVERLCRERGLPARRRSEGHPLAATETVLLGDTMGELGAYYATGQAAFVGGTLVPVGGHNVLEPAALGRPVIVGPHTANVTAAAALLAEAGGLVRVGTDPAAMADLLHHWLTDPAECVEAGRRAAAAIQANRGAVERILALLPRGY